MIMLATKLLIRRVATAVLSLRPTFEFEACIVRLSASGRCNARSSLHRVLKNADPTDVRFAPIYAVQSCNPHPGKRSSGSALAGVAFGRGPPRNLSEFRILGLRSTAIP
jgi:hypothetical protein